MRRSHRGSPIALPGFSTLMGRREEPVIPLHSLDTAMYAIQAYLLPCNHRKACRETKWTIRDRALPTNSKQICLSIEAPLRGLHGTIAWYEMANGPQLTTVPFSDKRCVHTSHQDRLLCLTLIVFSLSVPKQQEVHPNSSERTGNAPVNSSCAHPPPRATAGHLHASSVPGVGH